jgi:hypothetical protein
MPLIGVHVGPAHADVGEHAVAHVHEAMKGPTPGDPALPPASDHAPQPHQRGHRTMFLTVGRHLCFLVGWTFDAPQCPDHPGCDRWQCHP